ncbi:MAG: M56 family metallopeptidase [Fimbriimonas sp.]|nr:M56 family metallopeptidase [Fimbriimonas sp.]
MKPDVILLLVLQSTVLLAVTLLLVLATPRHPALRLAIGRVALLAILGLAIVSPNLRRQAHPVVPVTVLSLPMMFPTGTQTVQTSMSHETTKPDPAVPATPQSNKSVVTEDAIDLSRGIIPAWIAGIGLFGLFLLIGYAGLARVRRTCRTVTDAKTITMVYEIASSFGMKAPRVVEGNSIANPFVAGVIRPTLFLPSDWSQSQTDDTMAAVLHHEVAHIANGDLRWMLLHRVLGIVLWPQPLLWLLKKPMAMAAEELCDQHVLTTGISEHRYADCLLKLREGLRARPCPTMGIGAVSARSALAKRIEALFDSRRSRAVRVSRTAQNLTRIGGLIVAGSTAILIARPISQVSDPTANWLKQPYSGQIEVQDTHGNPVKGARAWFVVSGDLPEPIIKELSVSGATIDLNPGTIASKQSAGNLLVKANGYGANFVRLWPNPTKITAIRLEPPTSVHGLLKYVSGKPAKGLAVGVAVLFRMSSKSGLQGFISARPLTMKEFQARTDDKGVFTIGGLPPSCGITLDVDDSRYAVLDNAQSKTPDHGATSVTDLSLHPAAQITGTVTQDGIGVGGVRVDAQGNFEIASNDAGHGGEAYTDATGKYLLGRLPSGPYNVSIQLSDAQSDQFTARAHEGLRIAEGSSHPGVDFTLIPGSVLEGSVTGEDGKPIPDLFIGVYGPAHPTSSAEVQMMLSKADGSFKFHVPAGKQHIYVGDSRYQMEGKDVVTEDGKTTKVDLTATPAPPRDDSEAVEVSDAEIPKEVDDSKPTPPVVSFGPGASFYGPKNLHNGVTVSIDYVQNDASASHSLWRPDGSPASAADVAASLDMDGFCRARRGGARSMFLKVGIDGAPRGSYSCLVQTPHLSNWNVWQTYGDQENRTMDMASFHAPSTLERTDMKFGVAAGPFKQVSAGRLGAAPLYAEISKRKAPDPAPSSGPNLVIRVQFPTACETQDARLLVITNSGKTLNPYFWENTTTSSKGVRTRGFGFSEVTPADIDHVVLQSRSYEWVTFKGIHLYPSNRPSAR